MGAAPRSCSSNVYASRLHDDPVLEGVALTGINLSTTRWMLRTCTRSRRPGAQEHDPPGGGRRDSATGRTRFDYLGDVARVPDAVFAKLLAAARLISVASFWVSLT